VIATLNRLLLRVVALRRHADDDRGAQTVDIMLWVAVFIVIVGVVGVIFRDDVKAFFNSISYTIGFTAGP
jgi:undecaprenyl pyrophosphate phosphatase UppP